MKFDSAHVYDFRVDDLFFFDRYDERGVIKDNGPSSI